MYKLIMYCIEDGKRQYREWIDTRSKLYAIECAAVAAGFVRSRMSRVA